MSETLGIGIHPGLSFQQYQAVEALNQSTLKLFRRTPAHAHWAMTHPPEDTAALRTGDACHVAILEPERFVEQYVKAPKFDRRTNAGKAAAAKWAADHPTQAALLPDEWDLAAAMRDAAWAYPLARDLLGGKGMNELTAIWEDPETGLRCKGRMDRIASYRGWTAIVDLKTTRSAEIFSWRGDCAKYGYHIQAAFYLDGLNLLAPHRRRFIHLVVEKDPPYCPRVFELDDSCIEEGRKQYRQAVEHYAECRKTGNWPGYAVGIEGVDLPPWGYELTRPQW